MCHDNVKKFSLPLIVRKHCFCLENVVVGWVLLWLIASEQLCGNCTIVNFMLVGDRILAVRINFNDIDYKDAADILCSASPYEIEVELEDSTVSPGPLKNTSMNNHISHPFFRSQSFSTAPQVFDFQLSRGEFRNFGLRT